MHKDLEKVKLLARDLRDGKEFPRSPRATLAGYVLAARAVDKCRAVLVDWQGEYHSNCPLDQRWLNFAEIDYGDFRALVASGATDDEIAEWIEKNANKRPRAEIVAWNNKERDLRLSDLLVGCAGRDQRTKVIVIDLGELQPALVEWAIGMVFALPFD